MKDIRLNKRKIVNDPVYGFINIPSDLIFDLIEHPYFQRLRRIKQLGLTEFVYPGAVHTRFQHTLGAVHLVDSALSVLRAKGFEISKEEEEAVSIAILLHDIGHGPFSHTLEQAIVEKYSHEELSLLYMNELNTQYNGKLDLAISIFTNQYRKKFLHQLVSSQLDMDRLDYLRRDSFYTGVSEGVVSSDRIIKMLSIVNDELVVEAKGIYSIEKFLIARWLMYWQVYLHKTVVSAEQLLLNIFNRVKELISYGENIYLTDEIRFFFSNSNKNTDIKEMLEIFAKLDDNDIFVLIKAWAKEKDRVLSLLSGNLLSRHLYKIEIQNDPFNDKIIKKHSDIALKKLGFTEQELHYFVFTDHISKNAYSAFDDKILIAYKNGNLIDITEASDMLNMSILSKTVRKYFLCYPKEII
ncbi:MAG: phosphohydrolase [Bacteroidetes bacterium GWF2_33_16]|nr:MAG: phosphohydrolase [Bacteroidetes bacterium GWE2_32_14]OFY03965.1 MAG: phosphohydrolase [Bacteroidetes bacterium GWF2_33_16]